MLVSTLITAQTQLLKMQLQQSNQIRGMMKTFGLIASWGLAGCSINMSASWRRPIRNGSRSCCRFSPHSGICVARFPGWASSLSRTHGRANSVGFSLRHPASAPWLPVPAIEDPGNFARSRSVGAWLTLTTRRYRFGKVDHGGHISRRGDVYVRGLLYEAATVILTRAQANSDLRQWGSCFARGSASCAPPRQ